MGMTAPELLTAEHATVDFYRSENSLEWLKRKALRNQVYGASRIVVVCQRSGK